MHCFIPIFGSEPDPIKRVAGRLRSAPEPAESHFYRTAAAENLTLTLTSSKRSDPCSHLPTSVVSHTICPPIEELGDPVPALKAPCDSSTAPRVPSHLQTNAAPCYKRSGTATLLTSTPHPTNSMATPYAYEPVQPLDWSINALYNTIPFSGPMDPSYDYFSATTNFPSKPYPPHHTQPQPQPQYFQPPVIQEFDANAFVALSPSSVGSLVITPSLSPGTIPLPVDTPENVYAHTSHHIPLPSTSFEGPTPRSQAAVPVTVPASRGIRRRRQQEDEDPAEELLPAPKRRRCERPNSSVALPSVLAVPGTLGSTPAVTAQSLDVDVSLLNEQPTSWAPSVRKRRAAKRPEGALSASTRESAIHSVTRGSSAPLPDTKYGWLDHLLGSALEGNKRP